MTLPQVNARLTAVGQATAAQNQRDDWHEEAGEEPAGAGASKWSGDEPAYYLEARERIGGDLVDVRALIIETALAQTIGVDTNDVLTFTDPAGVERTVTATRIRVSAYAGAPSSHQTARLELADA